MNSRNACNGHSVLAAKNRHTNQSNFCRATLISSFGKGYWFGLEKMTGTYSSGKNEYLSLNPSETNLFG